MPAAIHCPEIGTGPVFSEGPLPLPCTWGRQLNSEEEEEAGVRDTIRTTKE